MWLCIAQREAKEKIIFLSAFGFPQCKQKINRKSDTMLLFCNKNGEKVGNFDFKIQQFTYEVINDHNICFQVNLKHLCRSTFSN
jgi:hypothetical protein